MNNDKDRYTAGEDLEEGDAVYVRNGQLFRAGSNLPCHRCGEDLGDHVQGRCPRDVEAHTRAVAKFMLAAIVAVIAVVIGLYLWRVS